MWDASGGDGDCHDGDVSTRQSCHRKLPLRLHAQTVTDNPPDPALLEVDLRDQRLRDREDVAARFGEHDIEHKDPGPQGRRIQIHRGIIEPVGAYAHLRDARLGPTVATLVSRVVVSGRCGVAGAGFLAGRPVLDVDVLPRDHQSTLVAAMIYRCRHANVSMRHELRARGRLRRDVCALVVGLV